jgi:TonB family protein
MKLSDFILPFLISAIIHVGAFSSGILHHNADVVFEKGAQAVTLNIVPSMASNKASSAMLAVARPKRVCPEPNTEGSERARQPSASVSHQDKGNRDHRPHHRSGVAAVNSKNNDGDRKEKGVTSPVVVTGLSKPEYPRYSRINGEEGTVVLIVEVRANGRPGKIEVVTPSGYRRLDCAAVKALEKAAFIPASICGKAVASTKRIAFRFDLEE